MTKKTEAAGWRLHLLLIDEPGSHRNRLHESLLQLDCAVTLTERHDAALSLLRTGDFDATVVEPSLPDTSWLRLLRTLRAAAPTAPLIVVTSCFSRSLVAEANELRALAVLPKPISGARVLELLRGEALECVPEREVDLSLAYVEWEHINKVLRLCDGNVAQAARSLGITRQSLYNKLRKAPRM